MTSQTPVTDRILGQVQRTRGCDLDLLTKSLSDLSWSQVFLEIDRLSREGQVQVTLDTEGRYMIRLPNHNKEPETRYVRSLLTKGFERIGPPERRPTHSVRAGLPRLCLQSPSRLARPSYDGWPGESPAARAPRNVTAKVGLRFRPKLRQEHQAKRLLSHIVTVSTIDQTGHHD
jgi:hypothetical protein